MASEIGLGESFYSRTISYLRVIDLLLSNSDEILYHAKLHPEQYSNTFTPDQLKQLHTSILHICQTAVDLLADASKFPDDWLFSHRWGKGKKDASTTLPNGAKITFLTVGGRTSCIAPSIQKKTGPVAADVKVGNEDDENSGLDEKTPRAKPKKKGIATEVKEEITEDEHSIEEEKEKPAPTSRKRKVPAADISNIKPQPQAKSKGGKGKKEEIESDLEVHEENEQPKPTTKKAKLKNEEDEQPSEVPKTNKKAKTNKNAAKAKAKVSASTNNTLGDNPGRRRSGRLSIG